MVLASGQGDEAESAGDAYREITVRRRTVAELAVEIPSPAVGIAVDRDAAGVFAA
jgi:hypothetical protein